MDNHPCLTERVVTHGAGKTTDGGSARVPGLDAAATAIVPASPSE